jgi:hypothetical protein
MLFVIAELFMTLVLLETVSEQLQVPGQFCALIIYTGFQRVRMRRAITRSFWRYVTPMEPGKNDPVVAKESTIVPSKKAPAFKQEPLNRRGVLANAPDRG